MIEETILTIFLTSGITIKVKESEKITYDEMTVDIDYLCDLIERTIISKKYLKFEQEINDEEQDVKHSYFIPHDKISWYIKEEKNE